MRLLTSGCWFAKYNNCGTAEFKDGLFLPALERCIQRMNLHDSPN
jgi:hypothetical protein